MVVPKKKSVTRSLILQPQISTNYVYNAKLLLSQAHTAILQVLALLLPMAKI